MAAGGAVNSAAAAEVSPSGFAPNFPGHAFFGDASGRISVYDASTNGNSCALLEQNTDQLGAPVVGQPLVFTGTVTTKKGITTSVADIFELQRTRELEDAERQYLPKASPLSSAVNQ